MADERIVTNIVANSDFSNLIADVQRVTSSLFKLQQELAGTNRALSGQIDAANAMFNQTMLKTGQFSSHFVSLTSDVEKFGRNLDSGRLKLKDYFRVYQEHSRTTGGLIRDLAKEQVKLQNAVLQPLGRNAQGLMQYNVHIPRGLDLTKNKTALLKQELQIMNKVIQDGGVQLINWGKNTQWAGRQLTVGLTLPLAAFGKAAADAFKQADQELTRLTKVYGDVAGTSQQELGRVRKEVAATAKELSAAMGVSFTETIGLAADIAATGKTGNELLSSVSETTRLAVLGEVDRQEAMKATLAIQSAFKQNTEELAGSINFLNAVENQTSTTLNDLVEAIPKAGPVIKGLGGSVQDLALYLTAMREGGINASEGANALKSALASLINPTDVAVAKFKGLGIDLLGIVNKNAGDVTQTLFALQAALDRLDPLQKQQAIEQLFGKFQFSRLNALFENLGRQGSQTLEVLDLMKASAGELESVAARELTAVTESASGRYRRAVESLKAELAGVGDQFLDIGTKIVNFLSKIIDFAQKLPDPIKKVLAFGGAFTAIIGPVIMLTGVLANFFGYIIKGVGHFKALFKGAEGFKLLTPEIIAARAASSQLGDEFYSDALAADTLRLAIKKLSEDLALLQKNATNATIASSGLGQVLTTTAGTPVMPVGAGRVVDPNNPLLGPRSRAAAHLNPRDPNNPATVFGMTLAPIPVNRTIGANPQVLMEERLPDIEGLTTIRGVSTGVVAPEHARYQALMATLGLQSKKEIQDLKKTIAMGGQVSSEFMATFDDILPITQKLTQNAATQSAAIVAQLHAGKMSAQQARDAIIAVNAQLERELGVQVTAYGAARGRTIDLTKAPLIDQPVVDASGKPNVRGMYRKGIFAKVMDVLGRATRTRTLGGPYSIETTRPIQRNMGGGVFFNNGDQVPGPNVNADVVPAMLTPGEFVIRRDVAQSDPDGMRLLNAGQGEVVPIQGANIGGMIRGIQYRNVGGALSALFRIRSALIGGARKAGSRSTRALFGANPLRMAYEQMRSPRGTRGKFWTQSPLLMEGAPGTGQVVGHLYTNEYRKTMARLGASPSATGSSPQLTIDQLRAQGININSAGNIFDILPNNVMTFGRSFNTKLGKGSATARDWIESNPKPEHLTGLTHFLLELGFGEDDIRQVRRDVLLDINSKVSRMPGRMTEYQFGNLVTGSIRGRLRGLTSPRSMAIAANRGGRIAAYNRGGSVNGRYGYARGIQRNAGGIIPSYKTGGNIRSGQIGGYTSTDLRYLLSMLGIGKTFSPAQEKSPLINVKPVSFPGGRVFAPQPTPQLFQSASALSLGNNPASRAVDSMQIGLARATESIKTTLRTLTTSLSSFRTGLTQTSNVALTASKNLTPTIRPVQNQQVVHGAPLSAWQGAATRQPATAGGMISPAVGRGGMFRGLVAGQLGWMAGSAIGGRFGGQTGSMIGGLVGSMAAPSLVGGFGGGTPEEKLGKTIGPVKNANWAKSAAAAASQGSRWGKVLTTVVGGLTKTNLVLGAATLAVYAGVKAYQNYQRTQELSAAQFGMTAQQAEKAGLKYTDFSKKVKDAVEAQKLLLKQNILTYQNMTNAKAPFEMTITEYKKLRKEVKETMSTQIDMLNVTKSKDLPRVATQLKQQFIAMGMSAEEANKKIFALFQLSNKASFTTSAMGAKSFTDIINPQTAAVSSVESFNFAKQFENTKDQAFALNTALMAIDAGISSIYDKAEKAAQKKKEDFDSTEAMYQAEAEMLDEINSKVNNQNEIGYSVLENLEKQNPFIRQMIKEQDTVVSMWQKMRIAARGYTGDLSALNTQQTQALYDTQIAVAKAVEETNRVGQLKEQYDSIEKLKNQQKSLESAARGQSVREQINSRDAIKNIDKKIKKINEEAEARKKALREEAQAEDVNLQVQQARLEYEQKVSAGDLTGAAEARLALQRILNEQQTTIAEQQIEDKRVRDVRPFEKQKERLQNDQQKLSDTAALAAESLDSVNKKLAAQQEKVDAVNEAMTNYIVTMGDTNSTEQQKNAAAAAFIDALKNAGEAVDEYTTGEATVGKHGQVIPGKKRKLTVQERAATKVDTGKINQILAESGMNISSTGPIYINGTALGGTPSSPSGIDLWRMGYQGGANSTGIAAPKTTGKKGGPSTTQTTTNAKGEKVLLKEGIFEMNMSQFVGGDKLKPGDVVTIGKGKNDAIVAVSVANGKVKTTGAIEIVSVDSFTRKVQFKEKYKDGGLLSGPGTGTSDSILGMYANGGMVKVSNGEYIINAQTVKDLGVPFFDAINGMKNGGLMTSYNIPKYNDGGRFIEAAAPQSSGLFNINNNFTINAPDGMDVEGLANEVALRVQAATARSMSKIGIDRNISTRYNG